MSLLNSLLPVVGLYSIGTASLACPGVSANGMTTGILCAELGAPPPSGTFPPPPPLAVMPVVVQATMDLVYLAILMVVPLDIGVLCFY